MATWVTHFRVAERLLADGLEADKEAFAIGNIGPDCSYLSSDGEELIPSKKITHYIVDNQIDTESLYSLYLADVNLSTLNPEQSFYLGYYVHLICDQAWHKWHNKKKQESLYQEIIDRPEYQYVIREDWYGIDFQYLKRNQDHIFWSLFQHIQSCPDYMAYYEAGQIMKQIRRIQKFYLTNTIADDHEFKYVTMSEVEQFVEDTVQEIQSLFDERFAATKV